MKTDEPKMNEELSALLDSVAEHGKNARRQQQLSDLIDGLAAQEKPSATASSQSRRHRLYPFWWVVGAAAACLLLWLLLRPTMRTDDLERQVEVAEHAVTGLEEDSIPVETSTYEEAPMAVSVMPDQKSPELPKKEAETYVEQELMAVTAPVVQEETPEVLAEAALDEPEVNVPTRRVIRSDRLVGCCKKVDPLPMPMTAFAPEGKNLMGQPFDPNMQGGMFALGFKLP